MSGDLVVFRCGNRLCALAVEHVEETMRPLPVESLPGVPCFVRGTSIIRGKATPIIDLAELLGDDLQRAPTRLITVRTDSTRQVGLLVDDVLGIRDGGSVSADELPPLLQDAAAEIVQDLARLDGQLLTLLRAASLLPEELWTQLSQQEVP